MAKLGKLQPPDCGHKACADSVSFYNDYLVEAVRQGAKELEPVDLIMVLYKAAFNALVENTADAFDHLDDHRVRDMLDATNMAMAAANQFGNEEQRRGRKFFSNTKRGSKTATEVRNKHKDDTSFDTFMQDLKRTVGHGADVGEMHEEDLPEEVVAVLRDLQRQNPGIKIRGIRID